MYCPKCRAEYRAGFTDCQECEIALVEELPGEPEPEYVEYSEVFSTFNPGDIAFIKSLFDSENITYYFLGELFNSVRPLALAARLMVKNDQVEMALELLADLKLSFSGLNPGGR